MSRPSFTYLSYPFKTLPIPHYEITIDYSGFSLEEGVYDVTFSISKPEGRYIEAYLSCLSDPSLDGKHNRSHPSFALFGLSP